MPKRPTLSDVTNIETAAPVLNANNDRIELAFDNTLSRDGSTPNQMEADLDLNGNDLLNAGTASFERIVLGGSEVMINDPGLTRNWATNPEDVQVDPENFPGEYSAFHYAEKAEQAAADAAAAAGPAREFDDLPSLLGTSQSFPLGTIVGTRKERFSYVVVASDPDLTTAGSVMLQVIPRGGVWQAAAMGLALDGITDDSPKIQTLLTRAEAVGGVFEFPAGDIRINSQVSAVLGASANGLAVVGAGRNITRLICPDLGVAGVGAIKVTTTIPSHQVAVRGFSILSEVPKAAAYTSGIGVHITSTINSDGTIDQPGWGARSNVQAHIDDVEVKAITQGSVGQWTNPILVEFMWRPLIENCTVETVHNSDRLDVTPTFDPGNGIWFHQCYWPVLRASRTFGRWINGVYIDGIRAQNNSQDFEEFTVSHCEIVQFPRNGIRVAHHNPNLTAIRKEPGGLIESTHIHAQHRRIWISKHRNFRIVNNNPAMAIPLTHTVMTNETGIYLEACTDWTISGNEFWEDGYYNSDSDCTRLIYLDPDCRHGTITGNGFGTAGIGVYHECSTDFVVIEANRWTSQIGGAALVANRPNKKVLVTGTGEPLIGGWKRFTFTPELRFGGATTGITYSSRSGEFWRRGNEVYGELEFTLSSKGSATGLANIAITNPSPNWGVPLSVGDGSVTVSYLANANFAGEAIPIGSVNGNLITLRDTSTNLTDQATNLSFGNITSIRIQFRFMASQD